MAGLLLLLYAQSVSTITRLTVDDIDHDGDRVAIRLGKTPVILPPPLSELTVELLEARRASTLLNTLGVWLFPGRNPGRPLSNDQLVRRLSNVGVQPRQDRLTALFALAAELPAAILARTLGIHIEVAVQWQRISGGDWNAYAADITTRMGTGRF